jgi:pimeloyl-ACP methyl ester carboxylesterase
MSISTFPMRDLDQPAWLDRTAYPFPSSRARVSGHDINYVDEGVGHPVLLVHGTPSWSFEWRHLIRGLAPSYRVIAPDLLGFGLSDRPRAFAYTPEAHAEILRELVDTLDLRDFTLVVHDFGGPIAIPLAIDGLASRLIVLNSWMWSFLGDKAMEQRAKIAGGSLGRFLYRHINFSLRVLMPFAYGDRRKLTPAIHQQYLAPFTDTWSRGAVLWPLAHALLGASAYYQSLWNRRERLREIPTTILWGTQDRAFEPRLLERWRSALPAAKVIELAAGHWPQEEVPNEVLAAVRDALP